MKYWGFSHDMGDILSTKYIQLLSLIFVVYKLCICCYFDIATKYVKCEHTFTREICIYSYMINDYLHTEIKILIRI